MAKQKLHPGILINKIPAEGTAGLIFVLGVVFILYAGIPLIQALTPLLLAGGLAAAAVLYWWRHQTRW